MGKFNTTITFHVIQLVLGTVDILDGGLDGASRFPDTNHFRKDGDAEVVIGLQATKDPIRGLFRLWDMDKVKEMDQGLRFCSSLKGYFCTRY